MSLRDVQETLADWIRAPEGVARALLDQDQNVSDSPSGSSRRRLEDLIRGNPALDAVGRLEIYANAYFHRILGVLSDDYPALRSALGEDLFQDLVTSYLLVEPSRHASLRYVGLRLPDFVSAHEAAGGIRGRADWAGDLAAFEWMRAEVFDASDHPVQTREALSALGPEEWVSLPLRLGPWVIVRSFDHPVDLLWREAIRNESDDSPFPLSESPTSRTSSATPDSTTRMIVWRRQEEVLHRRLDDLEDDALAHVQLGVDFAELCEWTATRVGESEAPNRAAGWLEQWLADGLLRDGL